MILCTCQLLSSHWLLITHLHVQIAALENRLNHSSFSLTEEKKILEDIKKLKASRATSAAYDERIEKLNSDDKLWNDIKEQMGQCDDVLNDITKKQVWLPCKLHTCLTVQRGTSDA